MSVPLVLLRATRKEPLLFVIHCCLQCTVLVHMCYLFRDQSQGLSGLAMMFEATVDKHRHTVLFQMRVHADMCSSNVTAFYSNRCWVPSSPSYDPVMKRCCHRKQTYYLLTTILNTPICSEEWQPYVLSRCTQSSSSSWLWLLTPPQKKASSNSSPI